MKDWVKKVFERISWNLLTKNAIFKCEVNVNYWSGKCINTHNKSGRNRGNTVILDIIIVKIIEENLKENFTLEMIKVKSPDATSQWFQISLGK